MRAVEGPLSPPVGHTDKWAVVEAEARRGQDPSGRQLPVAGSVWRVPTCAVAFPCDQTTEDAILSSD